MASPVCLRLSLAVCALHALAVIANGDAPPSGGQPNAVATGHATSLVDQVITQALGQVPTWDVELPQQLAPFLGDSQPTPPTTLIYLRVSRDYLSKRFERNVNRTKPVVDNILGTRIRGKSLTRGTTRLVFVPDDDQFVADIEFTGTVDSQTRGVNGPAILYYKSDSTFRATKRIVIDATGLTTAPARATATTHPHLQRIESQSGGLMGMVVERVARRRVAQSRQQAKAIASRHTADIVAGDLDRGLDKSMATLTAALAEAAGLKPSDLAQLATNGDGKRLHVRLRTTRDHAELVLTPEDVTWTELADALPKIEGSPHVSLRVHRSILTSRGAGPNSSPALAHLLAHGMKTQLAKKTAAVVEVASTTPVHKTDWSVDLNWLAIDVRPVEPAADLLHSAQIDVPPLLEAAH